MICQNCGNNLQDNFCPHCGERKFDKHELTIKHFLGETLESFFHFDNKFFKSLKKLFFNPGQLTLNFIEGRRVGFMKPLQLFLILNISLFFVPGNPFALSLYNYITYKPFTNYGTKDIVSKKIRESDISLSEYTHKFDEKIKSESKEFIFIYIPFYGILLSFLFFFVKRNLAENIVFACHFMGFYILLSILNSIFIELPFYYLSKANYSQLFDNINTLLFQVVMLVYLFLAIKKFYKTSAIWTLLSAASISYTFFFFLQYYRMLLFFKIIYLG
jgi:Protein of unknown function (DUF3667)